MSRQEGRCRRKRVLSSLAPRASESQANLDVKASAKDGREPGWVPRDTVEPLSASYSPLWMFLT